MEEVNNNQKNKIKNYKVLVGIIFVFLLLFASTRNLITVTIMSDSASLRLNELNGVYLAIIASILYIYSLFTKKTIVYYISIIVLLAAYGLSFYSCFNLDLVIENMDSTTANYFKYEDGLVIYILSFITFIIDIFIPDKTAKEKLNKIETEKKIAESLDIEGQYIFANYIYGLTKRPDLYNKLSVLAIKKETNELQIYIQSENIESIIIPNNNIISISMKPGVIMQEENKPIQDNSVANGLLAQTLVSNVWGLHIAHYSEQFVNKVISYNKMEYNKIFDIEIIYTESYEEKKMMFRTKESPKVFLDNFEGKFKKI